MPLSDVAIRRAKPSDKPQRLFDGGGLYLEVMPTGGKLWRWKYRYAGKEKRLALGAYPDVTLAGARERHLAARRLLAEGLDPSEQRKAEKTALATHSATTFAAVAEEMMALRGGQLSDVSRERATRLLGYLSPVAGKPIASIDAPLLLAAIRRIEARGMETAHRARAFAGQVFRYGIATGRNKGNPARDLIGALAPVAGGHFASLTEPDQVAPLLRAMWGYQGGPVVQAALKVAPMVFVRPGELRTARWADVDLDAAEWRFTASKTGTPHIVPLASQVVIILRELKSLTGRGEFVFPSERGKGRPMSENTINAALRALGYDSDTMTGHGFRAMARTMLDEVLGFRPDYIEHQLAHAVKDPNGRAYNRTSHLPERRKMMQAWADYLDQLRASTGNVVPLRARA